MIELENLVKKFGDFTAVNNLSFGVESGQVMGFFGAEWCWQVHYYEDVTGFLRPTSARRALRAGYL